MPGSLEDGRIIITGGGSGIGAETAALLARKGARVAILDLNGEAAERTAGRLPAGRAHWRQGDVTDPAAVEAIVSDVVARWGGIDGLINNAGTWDHGSLLDLTLDRWRNVMEVNLLAPIAISRAVVPHMRHGGAIVNVSSVLGQVAAPGRGPYCVSKAALISLTKVQAVEWAPLGVRVNAVAPGYIANDTTRELAASGGYDPDAINRRTPLGRHGSQLEVAEAIAFLLDPARAAYVTGHVLEVSGGWTAYGYT